MLTVLMPVSSVDQLLQISIESIKNQTFKGFVCHVLCRKLNDEDLKYINRLISDDERFVLTQLNLDGIAFALNYGLNLVKTKYVARMDADDISHPTRFEKQLIFLEGNRSYVMVGCRVLMINEQGEKTIQQFKFFEGNKNIRRALKYRMPLCHPAIIFRTDTLFAYKGYMYGNTSEDHELYLRIARNPNNLFENLPDHLLNYRRSKNQLTAMKNGINAFQNIAGFMFTEFIRTWNPLYLIGIVANHPFFRKSRELMREVKTVFMKT